MIAIIIIGVFVLGFGYKASPEPNNFYEVYLDDKALGTIRSEEELSDYIDENGAYYKRKFNVDKVYSPKGLQVRKLTTYDGDVDSVSSIYNKISKKEKFTIKGYEFVIKKDLEESNEDGTPKISTQSIYVLDKSVFKKAIEKLIETFVGSDNYKAYLEDTQVKIESTGENIQNVYINEDITVKETKIPVDETIYTDEDMLANYLLYGLNKRVRYIWLRLAIRLKV